jgi:acetyl/propionyl-CoA carboxylase alpha subunit
MSWIEFEHGGRRHRLAVVRTGEGVWVGWPGRAKLFAADRGEKGEGRPPDDEIRAPMTGKIVRVAASPGASVRANDVLVVMEAMKMEYRLAAPRDGRVEAVRCREGELVDLGRTLVTLERA